MNYKNLASVLNSEGIEAVESCPLAQHTTFKIGGAAKLAVFPKSADEAISLFDRLRTLETKVLLLGNGSNVLISDKGFDGVAVITDRMKAFSRNGDTLEAEAGLSLTRLASLAADASLSGLEFAYGIPGTVGGGIFMNAGAYGGELGSLVSSSRWYDLETGEVGEYSNSEQSFSYRHSVFMDEKKLVLSSVFKLSRGNEADIRAKMNDFMSQRREKQPLELPSAGSVFKRGNGFITAKLIEEVGLKGRRIGGAEVSKKHAGFIVNLGGATSDDVLRLIDEIKREIFEKTGFTIECEIRYIGS